MQERQLERLVDFLEKPVVLGKQDQAEKVCPALLRRPLHQVPTSS